MIDGTKRVRKALSMLLENQPFFGNLVLRMPLQSDPKVENVACDGKILSYNEKWAEQATHEQIMSLMARMVMAVALKHHKRRDDREFIRWQEASRLVTIFLLDQEGFWLEHGDERMGIDDSVENVYEMLPEYDKNEENDKKVPGQGDGEQGDKQDESPPDTGPKSYLGTILDAPQQSEEEDVADDKEWDESMHQAHQAAVAAGKEPGSMKDIIGGYHQSNVDWYTLLRQFMTSRTDDDYSWLRPNRSYLHMGLYIPDLYSEGMGDIVIAVDTSESIDIDKDALKKFWSEIRAIVSEINPDNLVVIQCDSKVKKEDVFKPYELPENLEVLGGGGTKFKPVFDRIEEEYPNLRFLIYFTDLATSDRMSDPGYPVLWVHPSKATESMKEYHRKRYDFGTVLELSC